MSLFGQRWGHESSIGQSSYLSQRYTQPSSALAAAFPQFWGAESSIGKPSYLSQNWVLTSNSSYVSNETVNTPSNTNEVNAMKKYVHLEGGQHVASAAVQQAGGGSEQLIETGVDGRIHQSLMPDILAIEAAENLSGGSFVNLFKDNGVRKIRKASALSSQTEAHGFVLTAANVGDSVDVYFRGSNDQIVGADVGTIFLSDITAGAFTHTAPAGNDNIVQRLGVAVGDTTLNVEIGMSIKLTVTLS